MEPLTLQTASEGSIVVGLIEPLKLVLAAFALILLLISLVAYRRNRVRRLQLVSAAFGLFFARVVVVEHSTFFLSISSDVVDLLRITLDLAVLILFFLAVVKR